MRFAEYFEYKDETGPIGAVEVQDTGEYDAPEALLAGIPAAIGASAAATWPRAMAYTAAPRPWVVAIRLGGEDEGRTLNREFRKKDYATNVLSFPAEMPEEDDGYGDEDFIIGDLFICMPVVLKEAAEQGKEPLHHLSHLVVHGLLHLAGYDHETGAEDAARMEALEIAILQTLNIPNPYEESAS